MKNLPCFLKKMTNIIHKTPGMCDNEVPGIQGNLRVGYILSSQNMRSAEQK